MEIQSNPTQPSLSILRSLLFPKKTWSQQQDDTLFAAVQSNGALKWTKIAKNLPNRTGKQCRERWYNHLNPNVNKEPWSQQEEWTLFLCHRQLGNKWTKITQYLEGRTDNSAKNHWNSIMKRKVQQMEQKLQKIITQNEGKKDQMTIIREMISQYSNQNSFKELKQNHLVNEEPETKPMKASRTLSLVSDAVSPILFKNSSSESDELSFNNMLKKIDQNDEMKLNLERKQSYQYKGFNCLSSSKKKRDPLRSIDNNEPQKVTTYANDEKQNIFSDLVQVQHLFQEDDDDMPLPPPVRRLSTIQF